MKKNFFLVSFFIFCATIISLYLSSCNHDIVTFDNDNNLNKKILSLHSNEGQILTLTTYPTYVYSYLNKQINDIFTIPKKNDLVTLLNTLNLNLFSKPIFASILFEENNSSELNLKNIYGISVFVIENNAIVHHFYKKDNDIFVENKDFCLITNRINMGSLKNIMVQLSSFYSKKYTTRVNIKNPDYQLIDYKKNIDQLGLKFALEQKNIIKLKNQRSNKLDLKQIDHVLNIADIDRSNGTCTDPDPYCKDKPGNRCDDQEVNVPECIKGDCLQVQEYEILDGEDLTLANLAFNQDLHYDFRDNFLMKTAFGQNYVNIFYILGSYTISNPPSLSLVYSTANFLVNFNSIITKLNTPSTYANDSLLTSSLKTQLISLLNSYKLLSTDTYYQNMIQDVIDDVNYYSNMTIGQFCTLIGFPGF